MTNNRQSENLFFFKQWDTWGSDGVKRSKQKNGKKLDRKILQAMPMIEN